MAVGQHGLVTVANLRGLGMTTSDIAYRVGTGRLHRLHRGVYAVGHRVVSDEGRFLAAVLAVGPGAALSHLSAAALWGFRPPGRADGTDVDVTVARRIRRRAGVRLHSVRALGAPDVTRRARIPVTTPARTLVDLADVLRSDRALRRVVHEAEVQRRVDHHQLAAQIERTTGRGAATRLGLVVSEGPAPTRSELEDRTLELLSRHGFPRPRMNALVPDVPRPVEVDFLFAGARLIVEADGRRYHETRLAREADSARQAMLEAAGYRVIRLSWAEVTRRELQTVRRLRSAFAAGPQYSLTA